MIIRLQLLVTLLILSFFSESFAGTITGKVTDSKGVELPFATIYVKGSSLGTVANANAQYSLKLPTGRHIIVCQYMGYEQTTRTVIIKGDETINMDIDLYEQALTMDNVVIKADAEDPAYAIIRKTIKRRKFHQEQVNKFQTSVYLKGVFRNTYLPDKVMGIDMSGENIREAGGGGADSTKLGVMYLCEQMADYYSDGNKKRTIIRSVKQSGSPAGVGLAQVPPVVSYYDNNVNPLYEISERGFISPIADRALSYYDYKYEGTFIQDGHTIDKIKVIPKRAYEPVFFGTIYIVEDEWAVHSLFLTLTKKSTLDYMDTLSVEQTYKPLRKNVWVIASQVEYFSIGLFGATITGNFVSAYEGQKIGEPIPDSLLEDNVISSYASDANDKDSAYWSQQRALPLEDDEVEDYVIKDSITARYNDPAYKDSMRRMRNKFSIGDVLLGGYSYTSKENKNIYYTNSILGGMVTYNTVEGIVLNPKLNWTHKIDSSRYLYGATGVRYGFGNTHLNAFGRFSFKQYDRSWLGRSYEVGVEGGKYIYQFNPNSTVTQLFNTYSTLLYGKNLMKLYERWTAAGFINRAYGNGLTWRIKAGYQKRLQVQNTTYYTIAKNESWTDNVPNDLKGRLWEDHDAVLVTASVSYQPGAKYIQYPKFKSRVRSNWPTFTLTYDKGISGILNSKVDYDKWSAGIADYVNMKLLGSIQYNFIVGGFLNDNYVSLPDLRHFADNELAFAAPYLEGFQLAPYYLFSNSAPLYTEEHIEYNMNGLLTNKLPLFRQARWNLVLGSNALYINDNNYYVEAFVGVDNLGYSIFRFLRLDLVRSWDHTKQVRTGFRIGIDFDALPGVSITEDKEKFEW